VDNASLDNSLLSVGRDTSMPSFMSLPAAVASPPRPRAEPVDRRPSNVVAPPYPIDQWTVSQFPCTCIFELSKQDKKSPANAKGNAQQRCMFESPVWTKSKLAHLSNDVFFTLARVCQMARPVSLSRFGLKSQISPTPSHLALSPGVTPFEVIKKLYGSWN